MAINQLEAGGVTRTNLALDWIKSVFPQETGVARVGILITDGYPTNSLGKSLEDLTPLIQKAQELNQTNDASQTRDLLQSIYTVSKKAGYENIASQAQKQLETLDQLGNLDANQSLQLQMTSRTLIKDNKPKKIGSNLIDYFQDERFSQNQKIKSENIATPLEKPKVKLDHLTISPPLENSVISWLEKQNIKIEKQRVQVAHDALLDELAIYLGTHYSILNSLYRRIKRSFVKGESFSWNLQKANQQEIKISTAFCKKLHQATFFAKYFYNNQDRCMRMTPQTDKPEMLSFVSGEWLERFVYRQICELILNKKGINPSSLINPELIFDNGDKFELDILFMIEDQPLWIECKTGKYQDSLATYQKHRQKMSLSARNSMLVVLDIDDKESENIMSLWDFQVKNQSTFLNYVEQYFFPH